MTNTNPTETPTQGHTPEKLPVGVEARDINDGNWDDQHCERLAACFNACRGLTAEQVVAIPRLIDSLHMTNIKAFDAMREALVEVRKQLIDDCERVELTRTVQAALLLADDCEASK